MKVPNQVYGRSDPNPQPMRTKIGFSIQCPKMGKQHHCSGEHGFPSRQALG